MLLNNRIFNKLNYFNKFQAPSFIINDVLSIYCEYFLRLFNIYIIIGDEC